MRNPGQKPVELIGAALTLTTAFVASGTATTPTIADVSDYAETSTYIKYNPSTIGNVLHYILQFSNTGEDNDWHDEPDESVASGVATVIGKSRTFVATGTVSENVPVLSMPVADKFMRIEVKEVLTGGGAHGTVIAKTIVSKLN